MTPKEREILVNRICAGGYYVEINNVKLYLDFRLSPKQWTYVDFVCNRARIAAEEHELPTEAEMLEVHIKSGAWNKKDDMRIETNRTIIKDLKKQYAKSTFNKKQQGVVEKKIKGVTDEMLKLIGKKMNLLAVGTIENHVSEQRKRCIYIKMVKDMAGALLSEDIVLSNTFKSGIDLAINTNYIVEKDMRELARSNPWRLIWNACNSSPISIFGDNLGWLTEEQKELCYWSSFYDGIFESYERPSNEIIENDLAIDAWYEEKAEERSRESAKNNITSKAKDAKEIMIPTDAANAHKIYQMNDPRTRKAMKRREENIAKKEGSITEKELVRKGGKFDAGLFIHEKRKN